jgi:hypothetical protein
MGMLHDSKHHKIPPTVAVSTRLPTEQGTSPI